MNRVLGLFVLLVVFQVPAVPAQDEVQPENQALDTDVRELEPQWLRLGAYRYTSQGMADPFTPLIQEEAQPEEEPLEPQRPLTPLEKIELSQLKLVGILWRNELGFSPLAMVELPDRKGFILRQGLSIGRNQGRIVSILPDRVIISEKVRDVYGTMREKTSVLKLHRGQEE
ncbi:MAG: pilus assembly protein PilP [Desulfonatronovibrionaceae bacterium]